MIMLHLWFIKRVIKSYQWIFPPFLISGISFANFSINIDNSFEQFANACKVQSNDNSNCINALINYVENGKTWGNLKSNYKQGLKVWGGKPEFVFIKDDLRQGKQQIKVKEGRFIPVISLVTISVRKS